MFLGRVVGTVWSSVKWPELVGVKLLAVRPTSLSQLGGKPVHAAPPHEIVVCADALDAGVGDDVIVAYGHAARVALGDVPEGEKPPYPIDAAVVAIVDRVEVHL